MRASAPQHGASTNYVSLLILIWVILCLVPLCNTNKIRCKTLLQHSTQTAILQEALNQSDNFLMSAACLDFQTQLKEVVDVTKATFLSAAAEPRRSPDSGA